VNPVNRKSSGVAIIFGGSILLAKRVPSWKGAPIPYGGYWSIFGGMLEPNETISECSSRELKEEADIDSNPDDLIFIKSFIEDGNEFYFHILEVFEHLFPKLNEEHTEYGWFRIDTLEYSPSPMDKKIIECINIYKNT
jgi:ADP-ribose pyrophosphatase YjhB (NUDIX family)